jgi:excisionase family DNA binding protein
MRARLPGPFGLIMARCRWTIFAKSLSASSRGALDRRAMSIDEFCERYGPGRTKAYEELKSGRLRARKCGKRTIITEDDAEDWLRRLPVIELAR